MNKINKLNFTYPWAFYLGHFLTQLDTSFLVFGIPIFASYCIQDPVMTFDAIFKAYGIVPLSAMIKLISGIFFGFFLSNFNSRKLFYFSLFAMGLFAIFFGVNRFLKCTSSLYMAFGLFSFCLFKFFIASEKASSLFMILGSEKKGTYSVFFYQLSTLLAFFLTGWLFYAVDIEVVLEHLYLIYLILGVSFILIAFTRKDPVNEEEIKKISFLEFIKSVCKNLNIIGFLSILCGIDQITFFFAMNVSPVMYQIYHPQEGLHLLNLVMLVVDLALLPVLTVFTKNMDPYKSLKINLMIQLFFFPLALVLLTNCHLSTLITIRIASIVIGLSYSISMINFLKSYLSRSVLFLIFIAKSLGTLLIMTPLLGAIFSNFLKQKNLPVSITIFVLLSLVGLLSVYRLRNHANQLRFALEFD